MCLLYFYSQGHQEVFDLIHKRKLYPALVEHLTPLMNLDIEVGLYIYKQVQPLAMPASLCTERHHEW